MRCSIGIAPNRYLAKVGTELQKPDGLVVLRAEDLPKRLFSLKLRDLPFNLFDQAVMKFDIALMSSQHADQAGTKAFGLVNGCTGFYPEGFGFIARGNCAGGIGLDRNNRHRLAA